MSLPHFLHENLDDILSEWERESGASPAEQTARRLHFGKVLRAVAEEMKRSRVAEPVPRRGQAPAAPHTEAGQSATTRRCARRSSASGARSTRRRARRTSTTWSSSTRRWTAASPS